MNAFKGVQVPARTLAETACEIEIEKCGEPIGKQDQYAAAIGGLQLYQFMPDESVIVTPVICSRDFRATLDKSTLIFYTGLTRSASGILAEQTQNSSQASKQLILRRMAELAFEVKDYIEQKNLYGVGNALQENWELKKQLASGISNQMVDDMYAAGMKAGALGGKLLGAGAGGFMMFLAEEEFHGEIEAALREYRKLNFNIENSGAQVIYYGS